MLELSQEMKEELLREINSDAQRIIEATQAMWQWSNSHNVANFEDYRKLEAITYITEQIRLKLRLLGAPRIS